MWCCPATSYYPHLAADIERSSFTSCPRYVSNCGDGIRRGVVGEGIGRVDKGAASVITASTRVNNAADCGRWDVTARYWEDGALLQPITPAARSKLPNRVRHRYVDLESAQNVKFVLKYGESTGQRVVAAADTGP